MNDKLLKYIIIFDGENEYTEKDILANSELYDFLKRYYVWYFPKEIENDVINENGTFYISTDKDLSKADIELKNVSQVVLDKFYQIYN